MRMAALEKRALLGYAIGYLTEETGVTQHPEFGSGLLSVGKINEVAHAVGALGHGRRYGPDRARSRAHPAQQQSGRVMQQRMTMRDRDEVARFFAGTDLVEPGMVRVEDWRTEPGARTAERSCLWCAVGRKR